MITVVLSRYGHEREVSVPDPDAIRELMRVYGRAAVRSTNGKLYMFPEERGRVTIWQKHYNDARNARRRKSRAK